jgi:hypothetical protein
MLKKGLDCNEAMQLSYDLAQAEARRFQETEYCLRMVCDDTNSAVVHVFVSGCKDIVMGLIRWR